MLKLKKNTSFSSFVENSKSNELICVYECDLKFIGINKTTSIQISNKIYRIVSLRKTHWEHGNEYFQNRLNWLAQEHHLAFFLDFLWDFVGWFDLIWFCWLIWTRVVLVGKTCVHSRIEMSNRTLRIILIQLF